MKSIDKMLDAIDTIIYGDLFNCAATLDELWRFSRTKISKQDLADLVAQLQSPGLLVQRDGYYCLHGRETLLDLRNARRVYAKELRARASRVARWLQYIPFVRGLLLTGSVAADDAEPDADIDVLVVVAENRLAMTFLLLGSVARLTARKYFCPNYYLSVGHLTISRRSHYVARELAQATPLAGCAHTIWGENKWASERLPNATVSAESALKITGCGVIKRVFEFLLSGWLGNRIEAWARDIAMARLEYHYKIANMTIPQDIVDALQSESEIRFHGSAKVATIDDRYDLRRGQVTQELLRLMVESASISNPSSAASDDD